MSRRVLLVLPLVFFLAHVLAARNSPYKIGSIALSPDGSTIAIDVASPSESFIYLVRVDTGVASRLTKAKAGKEESPAFSADGKRLVFTYWPGEEARSRIVILDTDGSNEREWSPSVIENMSPVFSPDGRTMVFSRSEFSVSYSPIAQPHAHAWSFYASDLNGTNVRQITNEDLYQVSPPSISPDGQSMVLVTEGLETDKRIAVYSLTHLAPPLKIYQPHVPHEPSHKNPELAYPNYLPDGNILFMAASQSWRGAYSYEVYRLNVQTGVVEQLTTGNGYSTGLRVSNDGKTAAFLKWRKNRLGELVDSQVYMLDIGRRNVRPVEIKGLP